MKNLKKFQIKDEKKLFLIFGVFNFLITNLSLQILLFLLPIIFATIISQLVNLIIGYYLYGKIVFKMKKLNKNIFKKYLLLVLVLGILNFGFIQSFFYFEVNKNLTALLCIPLIALLSYYFLGEKILFMSYFGVIFISLLKMIIIPLIFLSVVSGVSSLGTTRKISRIGTKTLLYYFTTSMIAITIGLVLTNIIQPGNTVQISSNIEPFDVSRLSKPDSLFDIVIRMIPTNIFNSLSYFVSTISFSSQPLFGLSG